ncbi:NAD(P)-binding protein [Corynespora cassiicola Philippines]|uniref:D-xylose 1-dehydrogenase (NADP(+), D-xylono-1,5-lactone-forming) n=1 Tax=Corynespora cassiicola Philippines TaxID=1448308 RepID=A0A2T2NKP0_CORCC|nr:NAD(P)-binding protein [Corynespora cassiicola Philippines]
MSSELPTLRWGIVGCGLISSWFVSDLVLDRPEATTKHIVQALGSSSTTKGKEFASKYCPAQSPAIYDSYEAVYNDPNVDIVYIGTPHVCHLQNTLDAIAAGKHVLCEKPFAMNARDSKKMIDAAKAKGVFLMEAVWTRFFPIAKALQSLLHEEKVIGDIYNVHIDFAMIMPIGGAANPDARVVSKALGAGALLDIGIYSLTWASLALDTSPKRNKNVSPEITSSMLFFDETDESKKIDEQDTVVLRYPDIKAQAVCTSSLLRKTPDEFGLVSGSKGTIAIGGVATSKPGFLVVRVSGEEEKKIDFDVPGYGFHYEADAVAEDIRAGRLENQTCPHETTLTIMSRMDTARSQCGLVYPQD